MELLEPWSAFALTWSVGATCDHDSRRLFSEWLRERQLRAGHRLPFPADGLVYDYRYITFLFVIVAFTVAYATVKRAAKYR